MAAILWLALSCAGSAKAPGQSPGGAPDPAAAALALQPRSESFTLPNGLRVVVHTDRKAPLVAINLRYGVGARNEPPARSGFAHLFEHLMFAGSDDVPGDTFTTMRALGAIDVGANTGHDDTVFYETVPTGAIDRALFVEANRMGHMRRTIDRATLDRNRQIVENEKWQNENQPYGAFADRSRQRLFPRDHPYGRTIIGSLATLRAAGLEDVRAWHDRYYVPANAVLVLSGDIDAATARRLVARHFGALPPGAPATRPAAPLTAPPRPLSDTGHDRVPQIAITRHWIVPGRLNADGVAIDVAAKVLGTLTGAWLDRMLVRDGGIASAVVTTAGQQDDSGVFVVNLTLAPGVTPATAIAALDRAMALFQRRGPTRDEIRRVVMREVGLQAQMLETAAGKAMVLSDGTLSTGDPQAELRRLAEAGRLSPATVAAAARRWLSRPAYTLTVLPGERRAADDAPSPDAASPDAASPDAASPDKARPAGSPATPVVPPASASAAPLPPITAAATPPLLPTVRHSRLSNGIELVFARRPGVALTRVALSFDAGRVADPAEGAGTQALLLAMFGEGSRRRDAAMVAAERERLGASIWFETTPDRSVGTLVTASTTLAPALSLLAEIVRDPALDPARFDRVRAQAIEGLRRRSATPESLAWRAMAPVLYGASSPYARAVLPGDPAVLAGLTATDLTRAYHQWVRPETARLFVVSNLPEARVRAALERAFGSWRGVGAPGEKRFGLAAPAAASAPVVMIDRPGSPQSLILGAAPSSRQAFDAPDTSFAAAIASDALGGGRINLDLRERRGWTYGAQGGFTVLAQAAAYAVTAPVQADRTGDALAALRAILADYAGPRPIEEAELTAIRRTGMAGLSSRFERGDTLLSAMQANALLRRPDDYQARLFDRYRTLDRAAVQDAARATIDPARMRWVIVGDGKIVAPQLAAAGIAFVTGESNALRFP